jgi:hypothetical protein
VQAMRILIRDRIVHVTNLQGGAAEEAGLQVTDLQGRDGHGFAKAGVRKLL